MVAEPATIDSTHYVYYEIATSRLDEQRRRANTLDTKAGSILSFGSIVLSIFGAALATSGELSRWLALPIIAALVVYVFLAIVSYRAYQIRQYDFRPDVTTLQQHNAEYREDLLREWVADECVRSIDHNEPLLIDKAMMIARAVKLMTAETIILTIALALRFLGA